MAQDEVVSRSLVKVLKSPVVLDLSLGCDVNGNPDLTLGAVEKAWTG